MKKKTNPTVYEDGFLLAVPKKNIEAYRKLAKEGAKIWMEYGALEYRECVGDDLNRKGSVSFRRVMKAKPTETIVFSWIVYKSKKQRNEVNKKIMKDPRMDKMPNPMAFDMKRMAYGGFQVLVEAMAK